MYQEEDEKWCAEKVPVTNGHFELRTGLKSVRAHVQAFIAIDSHTFEVSHDNHAG